MNDEKGSSLKIDDGGYSFHFLFWSKNFSGLFSLFCKSKQITGPDAI